MTKLYTVTDAAKEIGVNKSQVSRHADRLGLGRYLGTVKVLTAAEFQRIKRSIAASKPGNPNPRNALGRFQ